MVFNVPGIDKPLISIILCNHRNIHNREILLFPFMDDNTEAQGTYLPKVWQLLISSAEMAI